jgi:glycosyltransferase involved in cell wall biosynthesis
VAGTLDALGDLPELALTPYVTSIRAVLGPNERRLPIPAAAAHRIWARTTALPMDRFLGNPDVLHGTNYVVPPARCARVVSVYDCWFLEHADEAVPDVRRAADVLRRAVDAGAHVVTSSEATTQKVGELLGTTSVTTVPLGAPPRPNAAPERPLRLGQLDAPFVLALGTIERRKNIPTLVAAFAHLAAEHPTARLVLAGAPGDDSAPVHAAVDRLPVDARGRVTTLGIVTAAEREWLLTHAAVLAYPSLDEGFGFPILEAQQAGTPVVASSVGSIPEVGGPAVLLAPPRDAHALAANLHWMISDSAMRTRTIERGRRNADRFSWEATAQHLLSVYRSLVAAP